MNKSLLTALSIPYIMLPSCTWMTPAEERIEKNRKTISQSYQNELTRLQTSKHQEKLDISWSQALDKMYLSNPSLIAADFRIVDAKSSQKQVWTNMRPSISLGASDSFTIEDIGDALTDTSFRINSFLSLGNLLDLPNTVYERKLTYIGTELSAENSMRQEVIALYRLFQQQRLLTLQKKAIDIEAELVNGITGIEDDELLKMKDTNKKAKEAWKKADREWKVKVGDFFMAGFDSVNLRPGDIPDITYDPDELDFADTERWGLLQLNLLALEKIAEKGNFLSAYLNYLPSFNAYVSAPALFSSTSTTSFDPALTRISPSLSWSLDTRGTIGRQLDRLKRGTPLKKWSTDKRQREEITKLLEGKKALKKVQAELKEINQTLEVYKDIVRSGLVDDPEKVLQNIRKIREKEITLTAREIEISSSFWLIDEKRWKPITKRWLATRVNRTKQRKDAQKGFLKKLINS